MSNSIDVAHQLFGVIPERISYSAKSKVTTAIYREVPNKFPSVVRRVIASKDGFLFEGEIDSVQFKGATHGQNQFDRVVVSFLNAEQ